MENNASSIIDHLGGTTKVARMLDAPITTVHKWRKIGIPQSRLSHMRMAARANGLTMLDEVQS
jgi:hypothetical protein